MTNAKQERNKKLLFLFAFIFIGAVSAYAGTTGNMFEDGWNKIKTLMDDAYLGYIFAGLGMVTGGQSYLAGDKKGAIEKVALFSSLGLLTSLSEKTAGATMLIPETVTFIDSISKYTFLAGA